MTLSGIFETIILLGAVQGFIVSSLLFVSRSPLQSSRLLAALIFLMALASFCLYASFNNWFGSETVRYLSNFVPLIITMPFGPLMFFYVRSSLDPAFKMGRKQRIHFYPAVIDVVPHLAALIFVLGVLSGTLANNPRPWANFIDDYNVYSDIPRWASVTVYLWASENYLRSGHQEALTRWLRQFIRVFLVFQVIWLVYLVPYVIPRYTDWMLDTFDWYPVYVPLAVLIYWLGIKGYVICLRQSEGSKSIAKEGTSPEIAPETVRHATSLLTKAMEEDKLYLNPGINLRLLSEHINIPQKTISAVLNRHIHKSFNEFINHYRIREVKINMLKPESDQLTIAGLAFEAGFNSLATFQRAFKASETITPKEYLCRHKKTGVNSAQIGI